MPPTYAQPRDPLPVGAYVASALMAAKIDCDSGEDVDRLIEELEKRGYTIASLREREEADEAHARLVAQIEDATDDD